jgi:hypothetical protein
VYDDAPTPDNRRRVGGVLGVHLVIVDDYIAVILVLDLDPELIGDDLLPNQSKVQRRLPASSDRCLLLLGGVARL